MEVVKYSLEEWKPLVKEIHLHCFNEDRDPEYNTFDFALLTLKEGKPMCYSTCIEFDKDTCYMQHGGALPDAKGTINVAKGYVKMLSYLQEKYKLVTTRIFNKNIPMIKLALGAGFIIDGIDFKGGSVFLNMSRELQ